jgi:hypothetical protein
MNRKVYFRGQAFDYRAVDIAGRLHYILYLNGIVEHVIPREELDQRSLVSQILDRYYSAPRASVMMEVLR